MGKQVLNWRDRIRDRINLFLVALLILFIAFVIGANTCDPRRPRRSPNLVILKILSLTVISYSSDYDDRFPPNMDSAEAVAPYLAKLDSKLITKPTHNRGIFLGNWRLAGKKMTSIKDPHQVIMFFDTYSDDGVHNIVSADGATRISKSEQLAKAIAHGYRIIIPGPFDN